LTRASDTAINPFRASFGKAGTLNLYVSQDSVARMPTVT
jgi:hypothetical protein